MYLLITHMSIHWLQYNIIVYVLIFRTIYYSISIRRLKRKGEKEKESKP